MGEIFQNTTLNSSDKAIIIIAAITVIVLVLLIMYKLDNLPANYKIKKKHETEEDDDNEEKMDDDEIEENLKEVDAHSAEEKIEQIFNNKPEETQVDQLSGIDFGNMDDEEFNEEDDEGPYSDKNLEMPDEEENEEI